MKKKLSLKKLEVKSFVTNLNAESDKLMGGAKAATIKMCSILQCSQIDACITARGCTV